MSTRRQLLRTTNASAAVALYSPTTDWLSAVSPQVMLIGSLRNLIVDNLSIESITGVEQRLNRPIKTPRAKSQAHHIKTVIKDGDLYHTWYRGCDPDYKNKRHAGHAGETLY